MVDLSRFCFVHRRSRRSVSDSTTDGYTTSRHAVGNDTILLPKDVFQEALALQNEQNQSYWEQFLNEVGN